MHYLKLVYYKTYFDITKIFTARLFKMAVNQPECFGSVLQKKGPANNFLDHKRVIINGFSLKKKKRYNNKQ